MKSLKNHLILFDAECPMCRLYTRGFTSAGMLDPTGAQPYQHMPQEICPYVDLQRAVNEIALVDTITGEVTYGIHSLFKVLANAIPVFGGLFAMKPFIWLMAKVYAFISYNRKVIIPAEITESNAVLQPAFKLKYRIAYLIFSWFTVSYILRYYAGLMEGMVPAGTEWREYLICGGQVLFQGVMISLVNREKNWDYLGNMMTISFAGALILLPALLIAQLYAFPALFYTLYFLVVAGLMFMEHFRRMGILKLGYIPTLSWLLYRIIVLLMILFI